ncbi:acyl-CoA-binding protein [Flagellimonas beolgyonensis]|jgi:acyl-CoA-binding protein|uniref:acyl-CoA-binding protein n=1 Tax=Flagellimonas beolgyonensis TaxID=864064 RepID=UPI003D653FBA|tara:strand:- start:187 stop:450 length:264 start_codon:yes stop_codon:yes gene_type:complete
MTDEELHKKFDAAVNFVNSYTEPLPADLLLKLYAYFKIANRNFENPGSRTPLINAFKANALFQAKNISAEEAMQKYVALVEKELKSL